MAKEAKKKSSTSKKTDSKKKSTKKPKEKIIEKTIITKKDKEMEKILIENFIEMQKVMTGMAEKFDNLTKQISGLLDLFENSAKTLTEKEVNLELKGGEKEKEVLEKLNRVLDQNKIIAKGITLMHETASSQQNQPQERTPPQRIPYPNQSPQPSPQPSPKPNPQQNETEMSTPTKKPGVIESPSEPPQFRGF